MPHAGLDGAPTKYESAYAQYGVSPSDEASLRQREASAAEALKYDQTALNLFNDYYTRCADCIKGSLEIWIPELPSGLTPTFINWPLFHLAREVKDVSNRRGIRPYTEGLDKVAIQSGDVFAFVEAIETKGNLPAPSIAPDPLACATDQSFQQALFEVGGARGGRGGLGQPNSCTGDPINRHGYSGYSCLSGVGGENSGGGVGGDAGNVFLRFLTPQQQDMTAQVNVEGGPGGSMSRFVVPRDYTSSDVCNFRDGMYKKAGFKYVDAEIIPGHRVRYCTAWIVDATADAGRDGRFVVEHVSLAQAWSQVYQIALAFDGLLEHNVKELAERAADDARIGALSFVEFLHSAARQVRVIAESKLTAETLNLLYSHYGKPSRVVVRDLWGWPATDDVPGDLPEDVRSALLTVAVLSSSDPQRNMLRFLEYHGGLLVLSDDAKIEYNLRRIREALGTQIDIQSKIRAAVLSIDARVLEIDLRGSFADAQKAVVEAAARINDKLAAYQADKARFEAENKAARDMFIEGFVGLFMGGADGGGFNTNPTFKDAEPSLLKMGKALIRVNGIRPAVAPALLELNKDLSEAQERLRRLAIEGAYLREGARAGYAKSLIEALEARRNSLMELGNRSGLFPDLYKNVWLSFVFSPDRNLDLFTKNLAALLDFARGTAVPEDVRLQKPDGLNCSSMDLSSAGAANWGRVGDCIVVGPSHKRRRLQGIVDGEPLATLKLPLVLIAPFTSGQKTFGTRWFSDLDVVTVN